MHIGLVGLGKMGGNMRTRLRERGVEVTGFDRNPEVSDVESLPALVEALPAGSRVVWVMVPAGDITRGVVEELGTLLVEGDLVVEAATPTSPTTAPTRPSRPISSIQDGLVSALWVTSSGITTRSAPHANTSAAAVGSTKMLNSAAGVMLPTSK